MSSPSDQKAKVTRLEGRRPATPSTSVAPAPATVPAIPPEPSGAGSAGTPAAVPPSEWGRLSPSDKAQGLVKLVLDRGVTTTVVGTLYGLDFEIENEGYRMRLFFDYYNRRLKVLDYEATDYAAMLGRTRWLADANDFDKIFLKATKDDWQVFLEHGYMLEGVLRYYFRGEDAYVLSRFRTQERLTSEHLIKETELIENLTKTPRDHVPGPLPEGYKLELARPEHIPGMVTLYREVFQTYPSPLTHPDYIQQTMERNIVYRVITNDAGEVVSSASADIDTKHSNAEMTDCATRNSERGRGLMFHLLRALENDLRERKIMTGYTLARAMSVGMNRVFYRLDYEFSGRLVNNCEMQGSYEDMNIWVKRL